jgi:Cd2+/Zn2+-exporting ATPase
MKKTYDIKNMDCAHCALKIEQTLHDSADISFAQVDFMKEKVIVESEKDLDISYLNNIVKKVDQQAVIYHQELSVNQKTSKVSVKNILLILGVFLMISTYVLKEEDVVNHLVYSLFMIASYMMISYSIIFRAIKNLFQGHLFDEHVLMVVATIGALFLSEYIEASAVMIFYQIGEYFQDKAVNKSRKNIQSLLDLKPKVAHLYTNNGIEDIEPDDIQLHQILYVKPGEMIPTDAKLVEGESSFDFSSITGESMPVESSNNLNLPAGVINLNKAVKVEVVSEFKDSSLQKMIDFVESNSSKKAKAEKFMTKFAKYYTPIVVGAAFIVAFFIPLILSVFTEVTYLDILSTYIERGLIFLVISCPCALVLSIPLSFYAGIGLSSKKGILVKSGSDLETIKNINHFVFDKTGTLTEGKFKVVEIVNYQKEDVLFYAALLESMSTHPIAQSIVNAYDEKINTDKLIKPVEHFSKGVTGIYDNNKFVVGNEKILQDLDIKYNEIKSNALIIYVAKNEEVIGYIKLEDQLKPNASKLIKTLKEMHKEVSLVTGDHKTIAQSIADQVGIENVYAEVMPSQKAEIVNQIKLSEQVAFIGDGVNDAMVLISADLGISMGSLGSDVAIEASDVVIVNDDPFLLIDALKVSQYTHKNVIQNIILALGIKTIVLILGTLGLANMWMAIFADVGVSLIAVLNAMRLLYKK